MPCALSEGLSRLAHCDPEFAALYQRMLHEWAPEPPPATIVLGGYAERFAGLRDPTAAGVVLNVIEDLLQAGEQELKNAVATGFWEALLAHASKGKFDFRSIRPQMGHMSLKFCREWDLFTGVHTPSLDDSTPFERTGNE